VVDPPVLVPGEAGLDVLAGVPRILGAGEAHRDRAADTAPAPPPALADQLVEGLPQDRLGAGRGERLALRAVDPHHRIPPRGRVLALYAAAAQLRPDLVLAGPQHVGGERGADRDVPVGDERVD